MSEIVCGVFTVEGGPPPWFERLRPAIVSSASSPRSEWRGAVAAAVRDEVRAPSRGGIAVVSRWLESILIDALRHERLAASPRDADISALSDERIGRVLARIHERPGQPWTLGRLAQVAAMSRSTFAARFRSVVHEPPGRYVMRVRLEKAERLLHTTDSTVAEIARRVGYMSEEAMSRAFKKHFGAAPGVVRRRGVRLLGAVVDGDEAPADAAPASTSP